MSERPKILVVEDERIVAEDIQKSLIQLGYDVTGVVGSGRKAIEMVSNNTPDLILMDIVIQGKMNGIQTAEAIREKYNIPVIYLTAYADTDTLNQAKLTEPYGYILKPFEDRELHSTIEMGLYKHRTEKKLQENEEWLSTILNSIGDAVIVADLNGAVTFMNPMAEKMTGHLSGGVVGRPIQSLFQLIDEETGEEIKNPIKGMIKQAARAGQPRQNCLINKENQRFIVSESGAPIRNDRGEIAGVVLIYHDITQRRETEKHLQKITHEESVLLNSVPAMISLMDKQSRFIRVNSAFSATLKKNAEEIHGKSVFDLYPEDQAEQRHRDNRNVIRKRQALRNIEEPLQTPDGMIWVRSDRLPYIDEKGNVMGIIGLSTDITDRKNAEEALKKSEERYRGLFETMRQGVLYFDAGNHVLASNPAAETIFGYTHDVMLEKTLLQLFSESVVESGERLDLTMHPVLQAFRSNHSVTNVVLGVNNKKGQRRWLLIDSSPVLSTDDQSVFSVFCIFTDITLRKEAEFSVLRRNVQLQSLNTVSSAVGGTLDLTRIMKTALQQVLQLGEFKGGALYLYNNDRTRIELMVHHKLPEPVVDYFEKLHGLASAYRNLLHKGKTAQMDMLSFAEEMNCSCAAFPHCLIVPIQEGSRVVGSLIVFEKQKSDLHEADLTFFNNIGRHIGLAVRNARLFEETRETLEQLKIAQDKLIQSEKLAVLGGLTSSVVHEIGNPLAAIMNSVDVLSRRVQLEGRLQELMNIICWETERLDRTIDELREFAKPRKLHFTAGNLADVIRQTLVVLKQDSKLIHGRKIHTRFAGDLPVIHFDADAMEQVILNLAKNALQAVDEGGEVTIQLQNRVRGGDSFAAVKVMDDGPGISENALKQIFEPYFTTKARGMGLGMHIVKQIVEAHGGTIEVANRKKGGAVFVVLIPANREENG